MSSSSTSSSTSTPSGSHSHSPAAMSSLASPTASTSTSLSSSHLPPATTLALSSLPQPPYPWPGMRLDPILGLVIGSRPLPPPPPVVYTFRILTLDFIRKEDGKEDVKEVFEQKQEDDDVRWSLHVDGEWAKVYQVFKNEEGQKTFYKWRAGWCEAIQLKVNRWLDREGSDVSISLQVSHLGIKDSLNLTLSTSHLDNFQPHLFERLKGRFKTWGIEQSPPFPTEISTQVALTIPPPGVTLALWGPPPPNYNPKNPKTWRFTPFISVEESNERQRLKEEEEYEKELAERRAGGSPRKNFGAGRVDELEEEEDEDDGRKRKRKRTKKVDEDDDEFVEGTSFGMVVKKTGTKAKQPRKPSTKGKEKEQLPPSLLPASSTLPLNNNVSLPSQQQPPAKKKKPSAPTAAQQSLFSSILDSRLEEFETKVSAQLCYRDRNVEGPFTIKVKRPLEMMRGISPSLEIGIEKDKGKGVGQSGGMNGGAGEDGMEKRVETLEKEVKELRKLLPLIPLLESYGKRIEEMEKGELERGG